MAIIYLLNSDFILVGDYFSSQIVNIVAYYYDMWGCISINVWMHKGFTDYGMEEVKIKKAFHSRAQSVVAVADHNKFDNVSLIHLGMIVYVV